MTNLRFIHENKKERLGEGRGGEKENFRTSHLLTKDDVCKS